MHPTSAVRRHGHDPTSPPQPTTPHPAPPPRPPDLSAWEDEDWSHTDQQLLDLAVRLQVEENAARARRLNALRDFHRRRVAESASQPNDRPSYFTLTPLQATTAEFAPLLGLSEMTVEIHLDNATELQDRFPALWRRCESGRLDLGRALLVLEQARSLANEEDIATFAAAMEDYFARLDDPAHPLCRISRSQLQRAARYRRLKLPQKTDETSFAEAFKRRRVSLRPGENGIAYLSVSTALPDAMAADYRLTLIAKQLCQSPDESRTLEQLRSDVLLDLIHGRLTVGATDAELEDDETYDGRDPARTIAHHESRGSYARPVINVTVPIQTLMGMTDAPGVMSGGHALPADLVRRLALHPEATWYRMLTDQARTCVELSVGSYAPTKPIWRQVVAADPACIWPGCSRASVTAELDHRTEYPAGETSTENLQPLCRRHHRMKHSKGFRVVRNDDGSYDWTTRFGSRFHVHATEQPTSDWAVDGLLADEAADDIWQELLLVDA